MLLPIICSVSARVDIKWGAAAFSCHFSAVFSLPWRPCCFLVNLPGKQGGVRWRGSKCRKGLGCQGGEGGKARGRGVLGTKGQHGAVLSRSARWYIRHVQQRDLQPSAPTQPVLLRAASQLQKVLPELSRLGCCNHYRSLLSAPWTSPSPPHTPPTASPLTWCQPQGMVLDLWVFSIRHRNTHFTKDIHTWPQPNPYISFSRTYVFFHRTEIFRQAFRHHWASQVTHKGGEQHRPQPDPPWENQKTKVFPQQGQWPLWPQRHKQEPGWPDLTFQPSP